MSIKKDASPDPYNSGLGFIKTWDSLWFKQTKRDVRVARVPELDAQLIAEQLTAELELKAPFRNSLQEAMQAALRNGAKGIKVRISGRVEDADFAQAEWFQTGVLPLRTHTLQANIDYGFATARTEQGQIAIRVWLYEGQRPAGARRRPSGGNTLRPKQQLVALRTKRRHEVQAEMQRMIESMIPQSAVPHPAQVLQARRNAEAREQLLREFGALTSAEVGDTAGSKATNRAALAHRWKSDGRVFSVVHDNAVYFPGFQFTPEGQPVRAIADIVAILGPSRSGWELALWFTASNGWLGGKRPVDLLGASPDAVIEAARREAEDRVF